MKNTLSAAIETLNEIDETIIKESWTMITGKDPNHPRYGYFSLGFQAALIKLLSLDKIKFDD